MLRIALVMTAAAVAAMPVRAADREFKDVVETISEEFHTSPTHIPLFGLVNMVAFVARPAGTKHIDLAVFEHLDTGDRDGRDIAQAIQRAVGQAWKPFVRTISNHGGHLESVFVYVRPDGRDCKFLVATIEPDEATVVQLKLNPDALAKWLASPQLAAARKDWGEHGSRTRDDDDR